MAIIFAYIVNSKYVFQDKCETLRDHIRPFCKFISARLLTMVIEVGGVWLLCEKMGMNGMVGKFCPGELVKKGRLAEQTARRINIQYPLRSIGGLDIAFDPAAFQIVEAGRFGVLKVNEVAGRAPDGGAAQGEGSRLVFVQRSCRL